ncbi:DUF998 domain-containing protein [Candidatus Dojkabacteria bacterium]|uniref:DUF998 domain-containing protein n=1 Tax=Candidatus Dojkabacteria bacterium TaxID=2099670 RepID=A0A955L675_9BACT|nr:DUF998 domain-containing protein [Candidatus Dojkabacteria bacterium]
MRNLKPLLIVFIVMTLVVFILPFFSAEGYSIITNTTSQLGAQLTRNAWIMNLVFASLAIATVIDVLPVVRKYPLHLALLFCFGISLFMTAIFRHAPIDETLAFNSQHDYLHSIFATITGFSFSFLAIAAAFIDSPKRDRIIAFSIGMLSTLLSLLFFVLPNQAGIWQRIIFLSSFAWLIYFSREKD